MTGQAELLQLLRRAPVTADQRRIDVTDAAPVRLRGKSTIPDASSSTREHQKSAVDASKLLSRSSFPPPRGACVQSEPVSNSVATWCSNMQRAVTFYSEGVKLTGDFYLPDGLRPGERRAGIVLCHGYTGVKDLYLPDNARALNDAGYVVLTFDYKGWGASEGPRSRLAPYSRVADVQAALTYLGLQSHVDPDRLGIYGTSYGGATVVWVGAIDPRVKCVVSVVGIGDGRRWMRSVRRPDEWHDLLDRAKADREKRVLDGQSAMADRSQVLLPDRQSAGLAAAARRANPAAVNELPLEFIDDTLGFHPEWVVDKIAPRPILFITTDDDRLVPPEESEALFAKAGQPKKLVVLRGFGHYEVYAEPAFGQVMSETIAWLRTHLPST